MYPNGETAAETTAKIFPCPSVFPPLIFYYPGK
jgi:hypothetical protein